MGTFIQVPFISLGGYSMLIEDIVEHGVQLKSVETKYIHAEKIHDEVNKEFEITANIKGEILNSNTGNSVIQIKVCNNDFSVNKKNRFV